MLYHHSESPEFIAAHLAEFDRTVETHRMQREAERLLRDPDAPGPEGIRELLRAAADRLLRLLRPGGLRQEPGGH